MDLLPCPGFNFLISLKILNSKMYLPIMAKFDGDSLNLGFSTTSVI